MSSGYTFPILDSNGNPTSTTVDMQDMFASRNVWTQNDIYSWGRSTSGELGLDDRIPRSSPVQVGTLTNWQQVSATDHVLAIKTNGTLWTWGENSYGQLGLSNTVDRSSPVQVGSLANWKYVSAGLEDSFAIKTDGTLWAWGYNSSTSWAGILGLNDTTDRNSPVQVGNSTDWKLVSASNVSTYAIKTDGTLWAWGNNTWGQLGVDDLVQRSSPTQIGTLNNWKYVNSSDGSPGTVVTAIKTDGTLWVWGYNDDGQLGLNDQVHRSSPTQVGSLMDWKITTLSQGIWAIKTDGTLWAWGYNNQGVLGLNDRVTKSSPTQVGSLTNWKQLAGPGSALYSSVFAIKTDGTLWAWGNNGNGQLGQNNLTNRSSPIQVGTNTNWKMISYGDEGAIGIVDDNSILY